MVWLIALVGASALLFWWRLLVVMVKSNAGQAFLRRACFSSALLGVRRVCDARPA